MQRVWIDGESSALDESELDRSTDSNLVEHTDISGKYGLPNGGAGFTTTITASSGW